MYTLEYFLKTGNLGKIKLYSTLTEVESILGKTNLILEIQTNIFTLKYDYLQLTFQENTVRKINILVPDSGYDRESPSSLDEILSEPWTLTKMNLEQFIELLNSYETIPKWEIDTKYSFGTSLFIIINNKVKVYCDLSWGCQISEIFVEGDIYYSKPV